MARKTYVDTLYMFGIIFQPLAAAILPGDRKGRTMKQHPKNVIADKLRSFKTIRESLNNQASVGAPNNMKTEYAERDYQFHEFGIFG